MVEQSGLQKYIAPHRKLLQEGFFGARASLLPEAKVCNCARVCVCVCVFYRVCVCVCVL